MTIRNCLALCIGAWLAAGLQLARAQDSEPLEMALFQEIPSVYTASKTDQSIERATAVVTVITEEDIRRSGARTLYEVLKRVPGFFPSSQATWTLVASRGLSSDGNDHVLLLIDGHVQNSIVGQGYQQQDMLPVLQKVKKIEIIRGPGSVLWGSSAVMGIINVITRDGTEGESEMSVAYGDRDGMFDVNLLQPLGSPTGDYSGIVSLSFWQSKGYDRPDKSGTGSAFSPGDVGEIRPNVEFPWGQVADWPAIDHQREGWELYSRIKLGEAHELLARVVESRLVYPWDTWLDNPGSDLTMRKAYVSYRHRVQLGASVTLNTTAFGDLLLQNRFPVDEELFRSGSGGNRTHMQDQSNEERAFGAETMGEWALTRDNALTFGVKATRVHVGPNRDARFNIADNTAASDTLPYIGVESGFDNTLAAYFEDRWDLAAGRTTLFFGGRLESNDFRDKATVFLPRGGVIQSLSDALTAKYVYNSGYLRPNAVYSKSAGVIFDEIRGPSQGFLLVDKSETIQNHEVQIYWKKNANHAGLNVFHMSVDNYISFDANNVPQGYKNLGNARSVGLEIEGAYALRSGLLASANYSLARATLSNSTHQGALTNDENETLNYPRHIYNAGLTWLLPATGSVNLNVNGWRDMNIVKPLDAAGAGGTFGNLSGETYVDLQVNLPRLVARPVELSIFCTNLLNNTDAVGMIVNNGVWHPRGRNVGVELSLHR
jgi:outer membrane receptor protein involved in Fe transport